MDFKNILQTIFPDEKEEIVLYKQNENFPIIYERSKILPKYPQDSVPMNFELVGVINLKDIDGKNKKTMNIILSDHSKLYLQDKEVNEAYPVKFKKTKENFDIVLLQNWYPLNVNFIILEEGNLGKFLEAIEL